MKITIPSFAVEEGEDFGADVFKRKPFGQALANIVKNSTEPLVIGLDGNWGEGKSTFVKMWKNYLTKEGVPSIYIDAFASDYVEDPFLTVAGAITSHIKEKAPPGKAEQFVDKAKTVGAHVLSLGAKVGIRLLSGGMITEAHISELVKPGDDISKDLSNSAEKFIKDQLINYKKETDSIEAFKEYLSTVPALLGSENTPITIIIDELDRCRPSFAVEMLEKIKHLFSVKNINFLLVINKKQLEESLRSTYGTNIDAHSYLQKFITLEATLPKRLGKYDSDIHCYCEVLANAHEAKEDAENVILIFAALGNHFDMSFRQLEKAFANLAILKMSYGRIGDHTLPMIICLCILKVVKPKVFLKITNGTLRFDEFLAEINYAFHDGNENPMLFLVLSIKYCLMSEEEAQAIPHDQEMREVARTLRLRQRESYLRYLAAHLNHFQTT